jgi:uncharacterized lipoprotein YddW (UPF0748 family)
MNKTILLILIVCAVCSGPGRAAEPAAEFRGVWLTTFAGLDWPKSYDPAEQQRSLLEIIDRLYEANFNTILFQVRSRGDAFYRSSFEPWARELTGSSGKDPGWDPLAFLIQHAHARGMEVHAWFNVYKVWSALPVPFDLDPPHILDTNPGWGRMYGNEWWLDPGEPGVHTFLIKVALDLIERYPLDGIHFDHIRYPGRDFDDERTYRRFGDGDDIHSWRRDNITNFVREFYQYATAIRPNLKIGSAPIGVFRSVPGFRGSTAYVDYYQDVDRWMREGIHDYIVPQVYWDVPNNPKFDIIMHDWKKRAYGRHVYGGIGIFRPEIHNEVELQVAITRALGIPGQAYFRYAHLDPYGGPIRFYPHAAVIPSMPWIESRTARSDTIAALPAYSDTAGVFDWMPPHLRSAMETNDRHVGSAAADDRSSEPQRYIIYRSDNFPINTNNPAHLLAVLPATSGSFTDVMHNPESSGYHYLVSRLQQYDPIWIGGSGSTPDDRLFSISRLLDREILLPEPADPDAAEPLHITIFMSAGATASVSLIDDETGREILLIEGYLDAGYHLLPLHHPAVNNDYVKCVVRTGNGNTERIIKLTR